MPEYLYVLPPSAETKATMELAVGQDCPVELNLIIAVWSCLPLPISSHDAPINRIIEGVCGGNCAERGSPVNRTTVASVAAVTRPPPERE